MHRRAHGPLCPVDLSAPSLRTIARRKSPSVELSKVLGSLERYPFAPGTFRAYCRAHGSYSRYRPHKSTRPVSGNLGCGLQLRIARRQSQARMAWTVVADKRHFMAISKWMLSDCANSRLCMAGFLI